MAARQTVSRLVKGPAKRLRRVIFPDYTRLIAELGAIREEQRSLRERLDMTLKLAESAEPRFRELDEGLLEARRLNLRIAELTDVVTELVLPLHDRDIDPARLATLAPDTL